MRAPPGRGGAAATARHRGIRGTARVYIGGTLAAKSARFLLIPLYVHQLAPPDVGMLLFLETVAIALGRALTLSLGQAVKRFYVDYSTDEEADNFVAALWCISFVFAIAVGAVLVTTALLYGQHLSRQVPAEFIILAIVSGILRSNIGIALERFIVREEPYRHGLFNIGHFATTAIFAIIAVAVLQLGVRGALWADISALVLWNLLTAHIVLRRTWPRFEWPELFAGIRYSLPAVPHSLSTWALAFADRLILERLVPLALVGVYSIGYQSASLLPLFAIAVVNAWLPRFFRSAGAEAGPANYARVLTLQLTMITGIALPLIAFAPEVIGVIATSSYSGAIPVMRVVAVGLIFQGIYQALLLPLFYRKQTSLVSGITAMALFANVTLNLALIPRFGILGASIATLLAYGSTVATAVIVVARHYPVPIDYRRIGLIAGLAGMAAAGAIHSESPVLVLGILAKLAWLGAFYIPILLVPGLLVPGPPPFIRRIRRRSLITTTSDL